MAFKSSGITGSGISKTETREVESFDKIDVSGVGKVVVRFGPEQSLKVTADDDLLEYISTNVNNGKLRIRLTESLNVVSKIQYDIVVNNLTSLGLSGATSFDIEGLDGDEFTLDLSGATSGSASGTVQHLKVGISGAGSANLSELQSATADVNLSGASSAEVFASESFNGSVSGVGKIDVYGSPDDVRESTSGVGKINVH
jgi:hypothetical protein